MKKRSVPRRKTERPQSAGVVFSRNLRRFCRSQGLTSQVISERMGWDQKKVDRLLSGEIVPGLAAIGQIARKLKAPLTMLLRGL
jgi:transcriptional regulator with XRE-family HTH domain